MKKLAGNLVARFSMAGAVASAVLFALPVWAQDARLSLADRVTRLEQQAQNKDQGGIGMVNQMQEMQSQLRQMQGQVEELQHRLQELDDKNKAQYIDLDSRLGRLEGAGAGAGTEAAAGAAAAATQSGAPAPSTTANAPASAANGEVPAAGDPADAQAAYDVAFKSIRAGDYVNSAREFRDFVQQYPDHALAPNAWYWLGESYYATTNYAVALESFQHLLNQFPNSDKAPDALLKAGYSQLELRQDAEGKATLLAVISEYPESRAASLAQQRLQRLSRAGN